MCEFSVTKKEPFEVCFADVLPSYGKTFWSTSVINDSYLMNLKRTCFVYAASTHQLAKQVREDLIAKGVKAEDIFYILPKGEKDDEGRENRISPSEQLCFLLNGCSQKEFPTTMNFVPQLAPRQVIITTHENLWYCSAKGYFDNPLCFPSRENIMLFMDEAGECELRTTQLQLSGKDHIERFFKVIGLNEGEVGDYIPVEFTKEMVDELRLYLGETVEKLFDTEIVSSSSCFHKSPDVVSVHINTKEKTECKITLQFLVLPYCLFYGWKYMALLSAQFKTSQLMHILKLCADKEHMTEKQKILFQYFPAVKLKDISQFIISEERVNACNARVRSITIAHIFYNEMSMDKLEGYVMQEKNLEELIEEAAKVKKLIKSFQGVSPSSLHDLFTISFNEKAKIRKPELYKEIVEGLKKVKRLLKCAKSTGEPIPALTFLSVKVHKIAKEWAKDPKHHCHITKDGKVLLLGLNKHAPKRSEFVGRGKRVTPTCIEIDPTLFNDYVPENIKKDIEDISGNVSGMNCYQDCPCICSGAATRMTPQDKGFWKTYVPEYDADENRMDANTLQTVFRCSVRDVNSDSCPLIVVVGERSATGLINRLSNYIRGVEKDITLLHPEDLGLERLVIVNKILTGKEMRERRKKYLEAYRKTATAKRKAKAYNEKLDTQARQTYYKIHCKELYQEKSAIWARINYYTKKGDLARVKELRVKQKENADRLSEALLVLRGIFKRSWKKDEAFTQDLINKVNEKNKVKNCSSESCGDSNVNSNANSNVSTCAVSSSLSSLLTKEVTAKARSVFLYDIKGLGELKTTINKLRCSITYNKRKGDKEKVAELKKELGFKLKRYSTLSFVCRKEFSDKWGYNEEFTNNLLEYVGNAVASKEKEE